MSQHGSFYSMPNRSGSSTNLSFGRAGTNTNGSSGKNTQQPFFAASSSLPGALGIGSSSSTSTTISPSLSGGTTPGWTLSNSSYGSSGSSGHNYINSSNQWTRSSASSSSTLPQERFALTTSPSSLSSDEAGRDGAPLYKMRSNSSSSLLIDNGALKMGGATSTLSSSQGSDGSSSNEMGARPKTAGSMGGGPNSSNTRNFLVPIGATGARQKLSILSASQRPKTAQSTAQSQAPPSSFGDPRLRRRPQTEERAPADSNSFGARSMSGKKDGSRRTEAEAGEHTRSNSADAFATARINEVDSSEAHSARWSSGGSNGRAPGLFPTNANVATGAVRTWREDHTLDTGATPTQERPNPIMHRQASYDSVRSAGNSIPSNAQSSTSLNKDSTGMARPSSRSGKLGLGRRLVSRDGVTEQSSSPDLSKGGSEAKQTVSPKLRSAGRPSSSSGRERAAKLGAGFKSMFSSKSAKEQLPKMPSQGSLIKSPSGSSLKQHPPSSFSQQAPIVSRTPPEPKISQTMQQHSRAFSTSNKPLASQTSYIDFNSAESAGWIASHERTQSYTSFDHSQTKNRSSLSNTDEADGGEDNEWESEESAERASDAAPSLDLAFQSEGLFDSLASENFLSPSTEEAQSKGQGARQQSKAAPTMGLNLDFAGSSFPSHQYVAEQDSGSYAADKAPGADKSLPPTPDLGNATPSTATSPAGEAKLPQQRNASGASTWSQNTILASSAPVQYPSIKTQGPPNRVASTSSLAESSRRGSTATVQSDANGSTSDGNHLSARRPSSSAQSSSEESYSAPNSSRAWSPASFDKPSVPFTSPLLAPVLGQQSRGQMPPLADNLQTAQRRVVSPLAAMGGAGLSAESDEMTSPSTAASARSVESTTPRPELPTKSRDRLTALQPDPATLAKLERGTGGLQAVESVKSNRSPLDASSDDSSATVRSFERGSTTPSSMQSVKGVGVDPSTYVPPNALTYTRKGTAVRPTKGSQLSAAVAVLDPDVENMPRWSLQGKRSKGGPGPEDSPVFNSHFSIASSEEPTSAPGQFRQSNDEGSDGQVISFSSNDFDGYEDDTSVDAVNLLPASAWAEVEASLARFKAMSNQANSNSDKGGLLRSVLLPFLALEAETPNVEVSGIGQFQSGKTRRGLFFEWIQHLLLELQTIQTSADRGAILESIACIIESRNFSAAMFRSDEDDGRKFYSVFGHILNYAIGELNKKGVYQNTLIFSGRLLAVAFFRVEGVASKLLRALPVNRFALERVAAEAKWGDHIPSDWEAYKQRFPLSLHDFCFQDARSYLKILDSQTSSSATASEAEIDDRYLVRQPEVEVEMSGNWLRRWQSDDSELFFSFCRSYHRQLAGLMANARTLEPIRSLFFGGPGYAHLATCIHQKCLSLVHRDILSVTTLSSQKNFNPGETANVLSGSTAGKPRHLEAANRRCTAIVVDIVRAPSSNNLIFGPMLTIHVTCLIKRTSLYDVQGVFCLLDWLDGVLGHMESAELPVEKLVDIEFIIQTVWLLLKDADHALALMRTIAFCYSNFAVLSSTSKNRRRFCEEILLHPAIFQKLFLSWSFTIRAYFLHLLVFRLARINDFPQPEDDYKGKTAISVARLFNQRLDEIRRRHDELSPSPSSADSGSEEDDEMARFKKRPQSFVSTIRHTPSVPKFESPGAMTKAERVLGIGLPDPVLSSKGENKGQSRAAKWLRALGGKSTSSVKASKRGDGSADRSSPRLDGSPVLDLAAPSSGSSPTLRGGEARKRMPKVDELDADSEDDNLSDQGGDDRGDETPRGEEEYEFNFEPRPGHQEQSQSLHSNTLNLASAEEDDKGINDHISPNVSFDLQSPTSPYPPHAGSLLDPSPTSPASAGGATPANAASGKLPTPAAHGRVSRAFSKRQSILPGPAFNLVNHEAESEGEDEEAAVMLSMDPSNLFALQKSRKKLAEKAEAYGQNLHIYAVQSLREYEQTVQEHDDFFHSQPDASSPQVPRLPIQWPAMWSE